MAGSRVRQVFDLRQILQGVQGSLGGPHGTPFGMFGEFAQFSPRKYFAPEQHFDPTDHFEAKRIFDPTKLLREMVMP